MDLILLDPFGAEIAFVGADGEIQRLFVPVFHFIGHLQDALYQPIGDGKTKGEGINGSRLLAVLQAERHFIGGHLLHRKGGVAGEAVLS